MRAKSTRMQIVKEMPLIMKQILFKNKSYFKRQHRHHAIKLMGCIWPFKTTKSKRRMMMKKYHLELLLSVLRKTFRMQ